MQTPGASTKRRERRQVAALPWRRTSGRIEILLVTSRETRRWILPKGWRMAAKTDAQAAAQEALEEAGAEGRVQEQPLGSFRYQKILKRRGPKWCTVTVFPLEVETLHDDYKEQGQRTREWVTQAEAAARVNEPDLKTLILGFGG